MSDQTTHLTDDDRADIAEAFDHERDANCWRSSCDAGLWWTVERLIARHRASAAAEAVAGMLDLPQGCG